MWKHTFGLLVSSLVVTSPMRKTVMPLLLRAFESSEPPHSTEGLQPMSPHSSPSYFTKPTRLWCAKAFLDRALKPVACSIENTVAVTRKMGVQKRRKIIGPVVRGTGLWMVKRSKGACGKHVFVTQDPVSEVELRLDQDPTAQCFCIQPLLQRPLLNRGCKTDLRVYVLTWYSQKDREVKWLHLRDFALLRSCTSAYDSSSVLNDVQLTNTSLGGLAEPFKSHPALSDGTTETVLTNVDAAIEDIFARLRDVGMFCDGIDTDFWVFGLDFFIFDGSLDVKFIEMNDLPAVPPLGVDSAVTQALLDGIMKKIQEK